ncbi:unnamed protein product [Somion occarium]|uniref:NACHT domain-containing protein n=1 Tax=Somion occarium TaxID=3059160 RepID=A0ABP1D705_9APHY
MDPFSISVSILTVVEVAGKVALLVAKYVSSVKGAEDSRKRLLQELSSLSGTLSSIKFLVEYLKEDTSEASRGHIMALSSLTDEHGPLPSCMATLQEMLEWFNGDTTGKMKLGQRLVWPIKQEKKVEEFLLKLERYKTHFTLALSVDSHLQLLQVSQATSSILTEQERVRSERQLEARVKGFIKWLAPFDYMSKHRFKARVRQQDTCSWLYSNKAFVAWTSSKSGFLWLHGIPGSGKSTLASAVIDGFQDRLADQTAFAYFYCDFRDPESTRSCVVIRTLVAQLMRQGLTVGVEELTKMKMQSETPPDDIEELYPLLLKAASSSVDPILVIDALDECRDVEELTCCLLRLNKEAGARVFVTSRKEQKIYEVFKDLPSISLKHEVRHLQDDIEKLIESELGSRPKLARLPQDLRKEIGSTLLTKSDGMFRWVQCQLDFMSTCRTRKGIQEALRNLPSGLFETYERILTAIDAEGPEVSNIARSVLMWVVGAIRPLKLTELNEAIMVVRGRYSVDEDVGVFEATDILDICGSLLHHSPKIGRVTLSHFTVKEFLTTGHLQLSPLRHYHLAPSDVAKELSILTLTYLRFDVFANGICYNAPQFHARLTDNPLYSYTTMYWFHHVSLAPDDDEDVFENIRSLFIDPFNYPKALSFRQVHQYEGSRDWERFEHGGPSPVTMVGPLWYAITYGHLWVVRRILRDDPHLLNEEIPEYGTPLMLAAYRGQVEIAQLLLDLGAEIDKSSTTTGRSPGVSITSMFLAIEFNREAVVELLLSRGANPNGRCSPANQAVIHAASFRGQASMLRKLLQYPVDINATRDDGATALHAAIEGGNLAVVHLLIEAGCDHSARTHSGKTALQMAFDIQSKEMVEYLLSRGADPADLQYLPADQLQWASSEPWYPGATQALQEKQAKRFDSLSILKIWHILGELMRLPEALVGQIMDMAECWICVTAAKTFARAVAVNRNINEPLLKIRVQGQEGTSVRRIVFTTKSHDQGFSNDPEHHGTYRWSHTWFEAGASRSGSEGSPEEFLARQHIQTNVHGSRISRVHTNIWDSSAPDKKEWLSALRPGDEILLIPRAEYPAWVNYVEFLQIDLFMSL